MFTTAQGPSYWAYNYAWNDFKSLLDSLRSQGYRLEDITTYGSSSLYYAGTWVQDGKGGAWAANFSGDQFNPLLQEYGDLGYRVTDIEVSRDPYDNTLIYAATWVQDEDGWSWTTNAPWESFSIWLDKQQAAGRRVIDIEAYQTTSGMLYSGVSQSDHGDAWASAVNYGWEEFRQLLDKHSAAGKRLVDYCTYASGSEIRFAGAWVSDNAAGAYTLNFQDRGEFSGRIATYDQSNNLYPFKFEIWDGEGVGSVSNPRSRSLVDVSIDAVTPNPTYGSAHVVIRVNRPMEASIIITDLMGQEVATLAEGRLLEGNNEFEFDADQLPAGLYFLRVSGGSGGVAQPLIVVK